MNLRQVLLICTLVIVAIAAVLLSPTGPQPYRAKFELVKEGMTLDEISAVVGVPPGVYSNRLEYPTIEIGLGFCFSRKWVAADCTLMVIFSLNSDQQAVSVHIYDPPPDDRSYIRKVRDRIGF